MCGIVGAASRVPIEDDGLLARMRDTMVHRGPDDRGEWWSGDRRVGLAQRRLSIIDLSPGGHQPMTDIDGRITITFNGEIYNYRDLREDLASRGHRFRSESDTEVVLEAYKEWGVNCLDRLNGMFACGLFDSERQLIFAARDRAGEKPLFYRLNRGRLCFASELKALMADKSSPRELDIEALDAYFTYGYVPRGMCILQGCNKLPQGHALTYDLAADKLRTWAYWNLPDSRPDSKASPEDLCDEMEKLLEDSVRRQLVADVPVGVLLSGGVDSSLVTAMAARVSSRPVQTFTISFPGFGSFDEGPYARMVAQHFGVEHIEMPAGSVSVDILETLARQYDEPMADSSMVPTSLVSRLVRQHATVALGGDGGDELFGGYPHYNGIQRLERWRGAIPSPARNAAALFASRAIKMGVRGRNHLIGFGGNLAHGIAHINVYFDAWSRARLLKPVGARFASERLRAELCDPEQTPLRQATSADFQTTLVDAYLVKVDRASMLHSLEVRAPFLDYRLIEFAFSRLPDSLRAKGDGRKILPRMLARKLLPPALDINRKQGFSLPLGSWFGGEWGRYMEEVLREADPEIFDRAVINELLEGQRAGRSNMARLFSLTFFELWRREYQVSLPRKEGLPECIIC